MKTELQRLASTAERMLLRPAPTPIPSPLLPKVGDIATYLRAGRIRRHSGYVKEHAPLPVLAVKVAPQHPEWKEIWVQIEEIKAAQKGGHDAA
jgi:hypothetical protein